jgi:hypothetical protein
MNSTHKTQVWIQSTLVYFPAAPQAAPQTKPDQATGTISVSPSRRIHTGDSCYYIDPLICTIVPDLCSRYLITYVFAGNCSSCSSLDRGGYIRIRSTIPVLFSPTSIQVSTSPPVKDEAKEREKKKWTPVSATPGWPAYLKLGANWGSWKGRTGSGQRVNGRCPGVAG